MPYSVRQAACCVFLSMRSILVNVRSIECTLGFLTPSSFTKSIPRTPCPDSLNFFMRRRYRMWVAESFDLSFISSLHKRGGDTSFPASPRILFLLMTRVAHRAVCTPASAGGLAFFLITNDSRNNRRHDAEQYDTDQYRRNIFRNPCKHFAFLLSSVRIVILLP